MDENIYIGNEIGDLLSLYSHWLDLAVYGTVPGFMWPRYSF